MSCSYVSSSETLKPCLIGSDARGNVSVQSVAGGEVEEKSGRVADVDFGIAHAQSLSDWRETE